MAELMNYTVIASKILTKDTQFQVKNLKVLNLLL